MGFFTKRTSAKDLGQKVYAALHRSFLNGPASYSVFIETLGICPAFRGKRKMA